MKRYTLFTGRFLLVPMISGTFVVSQARPASVIEGRMSSRASPRST